MRKRIFVFAVASCLFALAVMAQSPDKYLLGVWKVNVAKSTYSPGPPPKSNMSTWDVVGGQFRNVNEAVETNGQATKTEIIVKFDGTDIPLKGAAEPTTRAYKRIDDRTFEFVTKVNGKVTTTFRSVLSSDGRTRTATTTGTNAQGQAVKNVVLWEKQ